MCLLTLTACGTGPEALLSNTPPIDNLSLMRKLVGEIGAEVYGTYGKVLSDTVILDVDSSEAAWIIRAEISTLLNSPGRVILSKGEAGAGRTRWAVHGVKLGVSYSDIRKPGIFSEALIDRLVKAEFTSEISNSTELLGSVTSSGTSKDTVRENEITTLESGEMRFTRGRVPDLKSWDRFIEPFLIIGATGTAIFLFFQVRS